MSTPMTTKFCTACANPLIATAVICPKCGSPVNGNIPSAVGGKSKTTAVLLAAFLGTFSWLYTYRKNASKFWITAIVLFGISCLVLVLIPLTYSRGYYWVQGWMLAVTVWFLYLSYFGFWLWSIIDNAVKSDNWYRNYRSN